MFRKNSQAIEEWSLDNVKMCAERQREILTNVAKCVAQGGTLIYSTCTFSLEENEMNVAWFLDAFKDFELCDVLPELKNVTSDGITFEGCVYDMTKTRRFYPHISKGEGQFIAVLHRKLVAESFENCERTSKNKKKKSQPEKFSREDAEILSLANDFLRENLKENFCGDAKYEIIALGGKAYLKPMIELPKYGVFAAGVCVGETMGKKFAPHHQLFSAFGNSFKRQVHLKQGEIDTLAYLKGLEINVADREIFEDKADGWSAVLVDGCPLGGGKISGGVCKNHYPKGLRNQQ
jgi:NOL1/NOP2/fmu family ribosome biogenesis protein